MDQDQSVQNKPSPKRNSRGRGKRPDQQLYVPRGRKGHHISPSSESKTTSEAPVNIHPKTNQTLEEDTKLETNVKAPEFSAPVTSHEKVEGNPHTDSQRGHEAEEAINMNTLKTSVDREVQGENIKFNEADTHSKAENYRDSSQLPVDSNTLPQSTVLPPNDNVPTDEGVEVATAEVTSPQSMQNFEKQSFNVEEKVREESSNDIPQEGNRESRDASQCLVPETEISDKTTEDRTTDENAKAEGVDLVTSIDQSTINLVNTVYGGSSMISSHEHPLEDSAGIEKVVDKTLSMDKNKVTQAEQLIEEEDPSITGAKDGEKTIPVKGLVEMDQQEMRREDEAASASISQDDEDEDSWDKMFDDSGDCLLPNEVEDLTKEIKKTNITIKKPKNDYDNYNPKDPFDYTAYDHVIELYDFPSEFKTQDLIMSFSAFKSKGVDINWVDDTHALAIFATPLVAQDALSLSNPMLRTRHLSLATKQSKLKAKECVGSLLPYKSRPETSAMVARNLVSGALGIKTTVSREKRVMELKRIKEVKEKRREDRRQTEDIWEGKI